MAIDPKTIADGTVPANSEPAPADTSGLPEEILAMPVFAGILQGSPAAVWTPSGDKSKEATTAVRFGKELNAAGMYFLRDPKEKIDVFYNAQFAPPEMMSEAQKKGKLKEVASPLAETVASFNGAAGVAPAGATPQAGGMPSPVPVDSALNTARVNSLQPGGPTSGNFPGAGRVLNSLTQNAI